MQRSKTVLVCLLMMSGTVAEAGLYDLFDQLYYGCNMLHWLRKKYNSQAVAAGSGAVIKDPALPVGDQPKCLQVSEGPIRARGIVATLAGHPKTLACAAGVLAGVIGYVGFTKLRDSRIDAQRDTKSREHEEDCKDLVNATKRYEDTVSVWGKSRDFATKITADKLGRKAVITWPVSK